MTLKSLKSGFVRRETKRNLLSASFCGRLSDKNYCAFGQKFRRQKYITDGSEIKWIEKLAQILNINTLPPKQRKGAVNSLFQAFRCW